MKTANILTLFRTKIHKKIVETVILVYFDVFCTTYGSNIITVQFWENIWNPLIKAIILDPQYKSGKQILFLTSLSIFNNFVCHKPKTDFLVCEQTKESVFYGTKKGIVLLFAFHGTGYAPKTWKKFSTVQNETPLWSGRVTQARQGQVRSCLVRSGHAKLSGSENTRTFSMLFRSDQPNFMLIGL